MQTFLELKWAIPGREKAWPMRKLEAGAGQKQQGSGEGGQGV